MTRAGRIVLLVALCALLLVPAAGGRTGDESQAAADPYWLGPYFAGLRLTGSEGTGGSEGSEDRFFYYGDCELPEGEGGCSLPAQVQNTTTCARNPLGLDRLPYDVYLLRGGGLAAAYEPTAVDVGTGRLTATVYTNEFELMGAALRDLQRRSQPAPEPLAPPVYPLPVLRELKRVTALEGRPGGIGAIARTTGLTPDEVRLRLRIAELLGAEALAGVPVPTMSTATVERLRQLSFRAQHNLARTAREEGISKASLRKKIRRVRGLGGYC
jgi:hypothetical protein